MRKTITANDLRIKGGAVIRNVLSALPKAFITVYGRKRYVIIEIERFQYLRDCELDAALLEEKEDQDSEKERPTERVEERMRR